MAASTSLTVIFVDSNVSNYQWLIDNRKPDAEVVVLDADRDGITQITEYLVGQRQVGSAQIISHGAAGSLQLGSTTLTAENLGTYAAQIQSWSRALTENAEILLLGCNVAVDERGKSFVQAMAHLTGADLAASTNLTGDAAQGGDWALEYTTGAIESTIAIEAQGLAQYRSVLAAFGSGNLVILRVGDGVNYGASMAPVFLDEYTTTGQLVQTIAMPTADDSSAGNQGLTLPGTRYGTGMLSLSSDGQYLTFGGWDQSVGTAPANNSNWVIGVVNGAGSVDTTTLIPSNAATPLGELTTVVSPDGVRFWTGTSNASAPAGGIRYATYGSQTTTEIVQSVNIRSLEIVNGQLYASSDLVGFRPVEVIGTGLPTAATTYQALPGLQNMQANVGLRNPQEFVFLDLNAGVAGVDTLYVTTLDGISKFSFNGTNWSYRNSFNAPRGNSWLGLTVSTSAAGVDLYAIQANRPTTPLTQLVRVTDTAAFNANFSPSNAQSLVISAVNTTFRGLAFTPSLPSVSVQVLDGTALETGAANTASFRVERTSIAGTMTVELALSGTAGANDYTVSGGAIANGILTVSIPPGQTFVDVVLTAATDREVEGNETFTVTLNSLGTYLITPGANAGTLTIIDNRLPNGVPDSYTVLEDGVLTVNALNGVLANDTDLDGNSLTVSRLLSDVSSGQLLLNADGSFTYTPDADFSGVDQFTYEVTDRYGEVGPVTVTLNVTPQPDAPVAVADQYSFNEDTVLTVDATAGVLRNDSDVDGNALTIVLTDDVDNGTLTLNADGSFTYTPDVDFSGTDSFSYQVNDGTGLTSNVVTVQLTVNAVPDAPVAVADQYSVNEDGVLTVDAAAGVLVNDSDADGNALTIVLTDDVDNGTLTLNADGSFTYTPDADFNGTDSFSYQVNDGTGLTSDVVTVQLTVNAVPDAPVAVADQYSVNEDGVLTVNATVGVLVNDSDADGNSLTPVVTDDVDNGTLTLNADGSFTYTPDADFNGTDRFSYQVNDGTGLTSNVVTVQLTVNAVPDAPVAVADQYSVNEDGVLTVDATAGVLVNDSDADGNSLTPVVTDDVDNGTLTLNADGSFTYTPDADFNGTDSFSYQVNDGTGLTSNVVTVQLTVNAVPDAPVAVADQYSVNEDGVLTVNAAAGVLQNDSDADGNPLTVVLADGVDNGTLVLNADGSFTYTPDADFSGTDSFSYQVDDGTGLTSDVVTVELTVEAVPDAPVAVADQYSVSEDDVLTVDVATGVLQNDSDADGNPLTAVLTDDVDNGTLVLNADGSFTYTPDADFSGTDSFSYQVNDGTGLTSNVVTVQLTVEAVPDAPVTVADQYSVSEDDVLTVDAATGVLQNDSDADGNPLTAVLTDDVDNGTLTLNADGSFTYTPDADFNGVDSFSYQVNDGTGLTSNIVTVQLTVNAVPDAPVAVADEYSVSEDDVLTVDATAGVLVNDSDADGNALTILLTDDVDNGTLTLNTDGSFVYTPNADYNGTDSFSYRVTDGTGLSSDIVTVQLTVDPVADAPQALPDQYRLDEDTVLTVTAPNGILSNDRDADGDALTVQLVDTVTNGSLNLSADGSFTYTPNTNFNGVDQFTYRAIDGSGQSNVVTVELLVGEVSETPVGVTDRYTTVAGSLLQVDAATGVLSNDQDVENDPLNARLVTGPANGTLTLNANGSFNYRPNAGFQGVDQFIYQANDGTSSSQPTTVTIDVTPANTAPQVRRPIADQVAWEDRAYVFRIPTNAFVDPEGDRLTYTARLNNGSALPQWLRFNGTTGRFAGTPGNANIGTLQVRVFATDESGATTSDLFRLQVNNTNDAPRLSRSPSNFSALVGRRFSLRLPGNTFVDEDRGDRLSYQARLSNGRALPTWLRFDPRNLSFQGLPPAASEGAYSVRLIARDRQGSPAFSTFTLRVRSNNAPVVMPNPTNIIWGTEFNDSDIVRGTAVGDRIDALGRHDYIRGFGGDDVLLGREGNDVLDGGVGGDWLLGGAGNDTHYGNTGRDVFVLARGEGTDLIADFEKGSDRIGLSGGISFANLQIVQGNGAAELRLNNEVLARLNGIQANTLTSSDFVSVQAS